jgi:Tol biopolymer transport system component
MVRTPAVAPDDRHIAFQVYRDGVWVLDTFTRRMRRVLADRSAEEFAWSPDGRRLAFNSRRSARWGVGLLQLPPGEAD